MIATSIAKASALRGRKKTAAMKSIVIEVLGDENFQNGGAFKLIRDLAGNDAKFISAVRSGLKKSANKALELVKAAAPVDTGKMRDAITATAKTGRRKQFVMASVKQGTRKELGIDKDDKWYYPSLIEYGTKRTKANPFIRNTVDEHKREIQEVFWRHIMPWIGRQFNKARKSGNQVLLARYGA